MKVLTLVVPCYNEEKCIERFLDAVNHTDIGIEVEILFVDDGSSDGSLEIIKQNAAKDRQVKYISFSRNFGKEAALLAGLSKASGDYVVTMDVDLQDPPSLLPEMLNAVVNEGYDCAATRRSNRTDEPILRSWFARCFYRIMHKFSEVKLVDGARDYRLMTRQVVEGILSMPEVNRFTKGIYQWVGFKTKWISFDNVPRSAGETKWSFFKLLKYALDGITAFSMLPLQCATAIGLIFCLTAACVLLYLVVWSIISGCSVDGWQLLLCVVLFAGGIQIFFIGVLGSYLAKVYRETRRRPLYLIKEESHAH